MNNKIIDSESLFKSINNGVIKFGNNNSITCSVIEKNGQVIRVITNAGMFKAFKRTQHGAERVNGLPSVVGGHNIAKFINKDDMKKLETIQYLDGNKVKTGFDAEAITVICDAYLEAESKGELKKQQEKALEQAKLILRALAKIGITALIDEATGYQYEREYNALQRLLDLYVVEKPLRELQNKFPRTYYKELYKIYNWEFNPTSTKHNPYVGRFTKEYVYDLLPEPVIEKIRQLNPLVETEKSKYRKNKYYQYLTLDTGIPELDKIISKLVGIMSISDNLEQFKMFYNKDFKDELELKKARQNEQISFQENF